MSLKYIALTALATSIVFVSPESASAQVMQGFQSQSIVNSQQPSEEDLAKADIGAQFYDAGNGVGIGSVFTNGPALIAGLQSGDTLTKANGEAIQNVTAFKTMIQGMSAGDTVKLTRSKNGKEDEVEVKLMTLSDVLKASTVPEPGLYDQAVQQTEQRISSLTQQIENTKADLEDLTKQLAEQQKQLDDLKTKAEEALKAAEAKKAEALKAEGAKKADAEEAKKAEVEAKKKADDAKAAEEAAAKKAAETTAETPQPETATEDK